MAVAEQNFYIAEAAVLILYIVWSYVYERWKAVRWLHQTGLAMLAGMFVAVMFQIFGKASEVISTEVILYLLLPAILLDAGYNLDLREIYKYAAYVLSLGILGSIVMFWLLYSCFERLASIGDPDSYLSSSRHRKLMAMVLTASDTVAPLALLPHKQHRRLHSVVFGEAIMNDVVTLFLSSSVVKLGGEQYEDVELLDLAFKTCMDVAASTFIGVLCGITVSWLLGHFRQQIKEGPVERPACLILLSCYITYGVADKLGFSGVLVMLIMAIVLKFFTRELLHNDVDVFVSGVTRTAGYLGESFMYCSFGMSFVSLMYDTKGPPSVLSLSYVGIAFACIVLCRIPIIFSINWLAVLTARQRHTVPDGAHSDSLPKNELVIVGACGTIRGVLAVVLLLRVLPPSGERSAIDLLCLQVVLMLVGIHVLIAAPCIAILKTILGVQPDAEDAPLEEVSQPPSSLLRRTNLLAKQTLDMIKENPYGGAASRQSSPCIDAMDLSVEVEMSDLRPIRLAPGTAGTSWVSPSAGLIDGQASTELR